MGFVVSMTQHYADMLRRHAAEWDKCGESIKAEATRQAARHIEQREIELEHALIVANAALAKECEDGDELLLRILGLDPEQYRTEGGRLNLLRVRAALAHTKNSELHQATAKEPL